MATKEQDPAIHEKIKEMINGWMGNEEEAEEAKADPAAGMAKYDLKAEQVSVEEVNSCVREMAPTYASSPHYSTPTPPSTQSHAQQVWSTVQEHHTTIVNEYGDWTVVNDYSQDTNIDQSTTIGDITGGEGDIIIDIDNNAADDGAVVIDGDATDTNINTGELDGVQNTGGGDVEDVATGGSTQVDVDDGVVVFGEGAGDINVDNSQDNSVDVNVALGDNINQTTGDGSGIEDNDVNVSNSPFTNVNAGGDNVDQNTGVDVDLGDPGGDPAPVLPVELPVDAGQPPADIQGEEA